MEEKKNENLNEELNAAQAEESVEAAEEYSPKHSKAKVARAPLTLKQKTFLIASGSVIFLLLVIAFWWLWQKLAPGPDYSKYKNGDKSDVVETIEENLEEMDNPVNFAEIQAKNPDVCAWIEVDGIDEIDYPILQSAPDADDNYYLDHNIDGYASSAGEIYIQKLNNKDFSDRNTLIYGHNMINGSMFGQLKKFRNKEFFDTNRYIYIYTPERIFQYEIISAFVYDDRHILNSFNFRFENECQEFFDECKSPSSYTKQVVENVELTTDDKIITLSTCTANDSERYLVVGKLVKTLKAITPEAETASSTESETATESQTDSQ